VREKKTLAHLKWRKQISGVTETLREGKGAFEENQPRRLKNKKIAIRGRMLDKTGWEGEREQKKEKHNQNKVAWGHKRKSEQGCRNGNERDWVSRLHRRGHQWKKLGRVEEGAKRRWYL